MGNHTRSFDTLLLDLDGVVISDRREMPGARQALNIFLNEGIDIVFVTNNVNFERSALTLLLQDMVSGYQVRIVYPLNVFEVFFHKKHQALHTNCFILGSDAVVQRLSLMGYRVLDPLQGEFASVVIVSSVAALNYQQVTCACRAVENGASFYATGRERMYMWNDNSWPGTGAILAAIEVATSKKAKVPGKPSREIFRLAATGLSDKTRALVVGDDIDIDIMGAYTAGFRSVLIDSGSKKRAIRQRSSVKPDYVVSDLLSLASSSILK